MSGYITPFSVSVYTSPRPLGKCFTREPDGTIKKVSLGQIVRGTVEAKTLSGLSAFAAMRGTLTASQALGYGTTGHASARVLTRQAIDKLTPAGRVADGIPAVARDAQHLRYAAGPGVLMLDHDPAAGANALDADELYARLCDAVPELRGVTMAWASSAGSMIYEGARAVVGLRGSRLYFVVSDATRIPEVGALLFDRLALAGHGRIAIAGSGRLLRRGLFDASVWQAERLDFVRATCGPGLEQRPAAWRLFPGEGVDTLVGETLLDVATLAPLTAEESARLADVWAAQAAAAQTAADTTRRDWAIARAEVEAAKTGEPHDPVQQAQRVARYEASANTHVLEREHVLVLSDGREVTVGDLRDDPKRFDGARLADPFEPEYNGDRRIARADLLRNGGTDPAIFSHAHGGTWYSLRHGTEDFDGLDESASTPQALESKQASPASTLDKRPASTSPTRSRFEVQRASDFSAGPPPRWHIRTVMPQGELVVLFGASGSGKSFAILDMVTAIAEGKDWRGNKVTQGRVVYVVAEGRAGFRKRLDALKQHRGVDLDALDLGIVPDCPNLLDGDEVALAAAIHGAGGAAVVVIDTLAQVMAGGDENSATEMGRALAACKLMHEATGATVVLVHHSGKDATKGARGWSGLRAAADAELEVTRKGDRRCIRVTKQKDGDDSASYAFELEAVTIGIDDDLANVTSCVVRHLDDELPMVDDDSESQPLGKWQRYLWTVLNGSNAPVPRDALVSAAIELEAAPPDGRRDTRKQNVTRAIADMLAAGRCRDTGVSGLVAA